MGRTSGTRRSVVLAELCRRYGFCTELQDADLEHATSAAEVVDIVIRAARAVAWSSVTSWAGEAETSHVALSADPETFAAFYRAHERLVLALRPTTIFKAFGKRCVIYIA
jgi:hypothetical protein